MRLFLIQLLLIVFFMAATPLSGQERIGDASLVNTWWVVSDGYYKGKVERGQVGLVIAFWRGKLYLTDADNLTEYDVMCFKGDAGTTFELSAGGKIVGKGLAVKDGNDILRLYLNHSLRGPGKIVDPLPDKEKCTEMFICLAFDAEEGKGRLARHGVDADTK